MDVAIRDIVDFTKIKTDITHAPAEGSSTRKSSAIELELARFEHDLEAGSMWPERGRPSVRYPDKMAYSEARELDSIS